MSKLKQSAPGEKTVGWKIVQASKKLGPDVTAKELFQELYGKKPAKNCTLIQSNIIYLKNRYGIIIPYKRNFKNNIPPGIVPPETLRRRKLLEALLESHGSLDIKTITVELFGSNTIVNKHKARMFITAYRKMQKKQGRYFYSVNDKHQFINKDNLVAASSNRKDEVIAQMRAFQGLIANGLREYPELRKDVAAILNEVQMQLLTAPK